MDAEDLAQVFIKDIQVGMEGTEFKAGQLKVVTSGSVIKDREKRLFEAVAIAHQVTGAPIEDHHSGDGTNWVYLPEGSAVGIPLRSLIVKDSINTMVIGRCFSATHDAHASIRSMAQCMAMGVAAGVSASVAVKDKEEVRSIKFSKIREELVKTGAVLEI
jgi:hypothetical protein